MLPRGRIDSQWRKTFEAKHPILTEEVEDNGRRQQLAADLKASGNAAFKANSMREALVLYTRALELTPSDHTLHGNSSAVQLQLGDFTAALSCAKEAIRLDVSWGKGYFRKAQALEKLERYSEASHAMEEAIRRTDGEKGKNVPMMMRKVLLEYQEKAVVATHGALDRPMSITSAAGSSRAGQPQSQGNAGSVLTELLAKTICLTGLPDEHSVREFCGECWDPRASGTRSRTSGHNGFAPPRSQQDRACKQYSDLCIGEMGRPGTDCNVTSTIEFELGTKDSKHWSARAASTR